MCVGPVPDRALKTRGVLKPPVGEVAVAVRPALPVDGVTMILGNDIAGSRVWADVPPPAIVASAPLVTTEPDKSVTDFPEAFRACAVTRAMKLSWCRSSMLTVPSRVCWTWCGLLGSFKDPVAEAVGERKIVGDISGEVFSIIAVISIVLGV
ncbi:uncharacterized protein LOC119025698 isoform X3 [Acanthopagrus latus]|uniref:uncharacterized protein LOC119025698 isoform X3 n=1 Tax=Acanthopagrus latus TaxID=8177 RepID=UPI00187C6748|nr:uncharacterized protein LOC119025698 isoform X3 [Acanthopagrus latus]